MTSRTVQLLCDLIAIDSVNPSLVPGGAGEQQMAEAIGDCLRASGLDVDLQAVDPGRPNVIGLLQGRRPGPSLILCGHLDTVGVAGMTAPFEPAVREGRVYGRGAEDMKGGLAAIVGAVRRLAETGGIEAGRVIVAGVADEEVASRGAEAFVAAWQDGTLPGSIARGTAERLSGMAGHEERSPVFAIVAEPTDLRIGTAHKGFAWLRATTIGRAAHGSRPREGRDAILAMGRLLARLDAHARALQRGASHPLLGPPSLHASFVEGGREWSTYPDRCDLRLERRTVPGEDANEPLTELTRILESLSQEDAEFAGAAELVFARPAYEIDENSVLVQQLRAAALSAGAAGEVAGLSFWADSAVLGAAGIPSVLFGPGGAGLHGTEEHVRIDDVLTCERVLVELARTLCV